MAGDDRSDQVNIERARAHVTTVAYGLSLIVGPSLVAGLMLSGALAPFETFYGRQEAIQRMRALLDAYAEQGDDTPPRAGHA